MSQTSAALAAGLRLRCPQCGRGKVFQSYLKIAPRCPACGADFAAADAGDGPAVFVMFLVGALVVPFLFILQFVFHAPEWVSFGATAILTILLSLALLPPFKSALFALQWKHKASEARFDEEGADR